MLTLRVFAATCRTWIIQQGMIVVICTSLIAGCSILKERELQPVIASAIAQSSCAPTDNAELELYLPLPSPKAVHCDDFQYHEPESNEYVKLDIYGTFYMHVDSTYEIGREVEIGFLHSSGGWGGWCSSPRDCVQLERGTVSFIERLDEKRVRFRADLRFEDGRSLSTTRVAVYCEKRWVICG